MKTIRARFKNGVIQPLELLHLPDETELTITIVQATGGGSASEDDSGPFSDLVGAWDGVVDCDQLLQDVYAAREQHSDRPVVELAD